MQQLQEFLISQYLWDMHVFSQPWIYVCLLIPAMLYLSFFILKWTVLTAPLWLPVVIIIRVIKYKP